MTINSIRVIRPKRESKSSRAPVAHVHMEIDNGTVLRGMSLVKRKDSYMLVMPSVERRDGSTLYLYHPISQEARKLMTDAVVAAYEEMVTRNLRNYTMSFGEGGTIDFSSVDVQRFNRYRELKGSASVVVDNMIVLNRIAILPDEMTGALRLEMPHREFARFGSRQAYFRFPTEDYMRLYHLVMDAYTGAVSGEDSSKVYR